MSLPELNKLVSSVKTSSYSLNILPACLFKTVFKSISPSVLSIFLAQKTVYLKNVVIHPLLKKTDLDPFCFSINRPISKFPLIKYFREGGSQTVKLCF